MKKRLLVIPAKGYSKRIKEKNIKLFYGKPIISYALLNAKKSKLFSQIHVSTESKKVKRIVEKIGFKVDFLRPNKLARKDTPVINVLRFVYERYLKLNINFDEIWTLSSCTPLLKSTDLVKAAKVSKKNKVLLSVTKFGAPIEWAFNKKKKGNLKPLFPGKLFQNSQKFSDKFYDAGSFAIFPNKFLKKKRINLKNNFIGFVLPRERAIDIDNLEDWKLAEYMYKVK